MWRRIAFALMLLNGPTVSRAQTNVQVSGPEAYSPDHPLTAGMTTYAIRVADTSASLRLLPRENGLVLNVDAADPSPATLATALDPLLGAVLHDHPNIAKFHVLLRDRDALVARLGPILAASPAWNGRKGRSVHGDLRRFIVRTINDHVSILSELKAVFRRHGYDFVLQDVGLISVEPAPRFGGKRLPVDIARMDFVAVKF